MLLGRLLNVTDKLAQQRNDSYISSELFILAALQDKGSIGKLLTKAGASKQLVEQAIDKLRGGEQVDDPNAEDQRQALEKFTIDVTERAEQGKLDPVIGRDDEIRRTIQVLQRRTKNNPVLIGAPGVGRSCDLLLTTGGATTSGLSRASFRWPIYHRPAQAMAVRTKLVTNTLMVIKGFSRNRRESRSL